MVTSALESMSAPVDNDQGAPGLTDYVVAVSRRPWVVVLSVLLTLLLGLIFTSTREETFTSSNRVLVGPSPVGSTREGVLVDPVLEREREILSSLSTADRAVEILGGDVDVSSFRADLAVEFQPDTDTLVVAYTSADPAEAAERADAFANSYVELRQSAADEFYETQITLLEDRLASNSIARTTVLDEADALAEEAGNLRSLDPTALGRIDTINSQILSLRTEANQLATSIRVDEQALSTAQNQAQTAAPTAELLSAAATPDTPDGIAANLVYAVAAIVGLGLGVTATLVLDRLDTRLRDRFAPGRLLGRPTLATIPSLGIRARFQKRQLVMDGQVGGVRGHLAREAIRRLRSSLGFVQSTTGQKIFIFTSAHPGEGKTTVVCNLAVALSQAGQRVILVSADLRRPRVEELFEVEPAPGLVESLGGAAEVGLVETKFPGLSILTAGLSLPSNPGELLGSDRARTAFELLAEGSDIVLVDTPPVLAAADTSGLASRVGDVVLVVDSQSTIEDELLRTKDELDQVGATIVGTVLNRDTSQSTKLFGRKSAYYRVG